MYARSSIELCRARYYTFWSVRTGFIPPRAISRAASAKVTMDGDLEGLSDGRVGARVRMWAESGAGAIHIGPVPDCGIAVVSSRDSVGAARREPKSCADGGRVRTLCLQAGSADSIQALRRVSSAR